MFDTCAETEGLDSGKRIDELNKLHERSDKLYLKAFKCQCWTLAFYILFMVLMVVYVLTMFFLALGAKSIT